MIDKSSSLKVSLKTDGEHDIEERVNDRAVAATNFQGRVHSAFITGKIGESFTVHFDPTTFAAHGANGVRVTLAIGHQLRASGARKHAQAWFVPMGDFAEWDSYGYFKLWNGRQRIKSTNVYFTFPQPHSTYHFVERPREVR